VIVTTVPNAGDYGELFGQALVVYYCVDDFSEWPGLDAELVREMEQRLIERADVFIATSSRLRERLAAFGKPTHLLTHGVDVAHFSRQASEEHLCLRGIQKPRAGFFGLIDARMDQELLGLVADRMPEMAFVLAGPVEAPVRALSARKNVHFTGPIAYDQLPSLIAGLDVLLIPYVAGALGDSLSPLKLKEYLATGKPIVSTPIAEAQAQAPHVIAAGSADEWARELHKALHVDLAARRGIIMPLIEAESWAHKAAILVDLCARLRRRHGRQELSQIQIDKESAC